jgi:hypothetical protein
MHIQWPDSTHKYISKAQLGLYGQKGLHPIKAPVLEHKDLMNGGVIVYEMTEDKNKCVFKTRPTETPLSTIEQSLIKKVKKQQVDSASSASLNEQGTSAFVINPVISGGAMAFNGTKTIRIHCAQRDVRIYFSTNGEEPNEKMNRYSQPFDIDTTTVIKAIAIDRNNNRSKVVAAHFKKSTNNWKVTLNTLFEPQYEGGGAQGLVDGIRGSTNWRMGNWQGYQLTNLDATIDLQDVQDVSNVLIGFLQDVRAWIVMPGKLTVLTSVNGKDYKVAFMGDQFLPIEDLNPQVKTIEVALDKQPVRYIRIVANQYGKLPAWHEGAGGDTHIFVDEVEIE